MFNLPKSTEFNKRIPKGKFYENVDLKSDIKRSFIDDVKAIYWRHKLAKETINLEAGKKLEKLKFLKLT